MAALRQVIPNGHNATIRRGVEEEVRISHRILMIAPTSFFADYGCHVRILEEVRALQSAGHNVRVCTYHNGDDVPGVRIKRTVGIPWRKRVVVGSSRHKMYLDVMLFVTTLREALRFKPDVLHAHLHEGALIGSTIGRMTGTPVVFDYQGSLTEEMLDHGFIRPGGKRHRFFRQLEQIIDHLPARILPSSPAAESFLLQRGLDAERIVSIQDAVDMERFDPEHLVSGRARVRQQLGIPESAPVVVYLGLLATYQGTPLLIEAARRLLARRPDIYFVIAGYPAVGRHSAMARDMPIDNHVLFPGRIPYQDAPALIAAGDVAVAPKLSKTEGNGKILNYMAAGLPVVATDTLPNRTMLGPDGIYFAPHDVDGLVDGIECSLATPASVGQRLCERAAREFSWSTRVAPLEAAYASILEGEMFDRISEQPYEAGVNRD